MTDNSKAVYRALHNVLRELDVDKDGVLPGNMGGSAYRSAEALTAGVRALFVQHDLILVPQESVSHNERYEFNKRVEFTATVEGVYHIISAEDGSSVTIKGVGRGKSTGTTVDVNIASTFALKNALQRFFLVSDNKLEEEGMSDGSAPGPTKAERAAAKAAVTPQPKAKPVANNGEREAQAKIRAEYLNAEEPVLTKEEAGAEIKRLKNAGDKTPYATLLASLEKGELPNG